RACRVNALSYLAPKFASARPRPIAAREAARAASLEAIRDLDSNAGPFAATQPLRERVRRALFEAAAGAGMPIYRLSIRFGLHWMEGVRQRIVAILQPRPW